MSPLSHLSSLLALLSFFLSGSRRFLVADELHQHVGIRFRTYWASHFQRDRSESERTSLSARAASGANLMLFSWFSISLFLFYLPSSFISFSWLLSLSASCTRFSLLLSLFACLTLSHTGRLQCSLRSSVHPGDERCRPSLRRWHQRGILLGAEQQRFLRCGRNP